MTLVVLLFSHFPHITHNSTIPLSTLNPPLMSTAQPSSNFQQIFDSALQTYRLRTNNDLLAHPLAARFQASDSPDSILAVLQEQVRGLDGSQRNYTRWLDPTVKVLRTFSGILGESVNLVYFRR